MCKCGTGADEAIPAQASAANRPEDMSAIVRRIISTAKAPKPVGPYK